ncbi:MAG: hypothetical protein KGL39_59950, partial [Patescibacteria group bacterium]|nr:hypothetical protein [Patescibacteria group bacterium]
MSHTSITPDPMDRALAQIAVMNAKAVEISRRINTDRRAAFLARRAVELRPRITKAGVAGSDQLFASLASTDHYRSLQAAELHSARVGQIEGHPKVTAFHLNRARGFRRDAERFARV